MWILLADYFFLAHSVHASDHFQSLVPFLLPSNEMSTMRKKRKHVDDLLWIEFSSEQNI